jgi:hypothetical protein
VPLVFLLSVIAACSSTGRPEAIADPRSTSTTSTTAAPEAVDADQVVWQEFTGGGFVPTFTAARDAPEVTIYRDGRIFTQVRQPADQLGAPVAFEQAEVSQADLDAFLADAEASRLFEPGTEFGAPGVTDQPSTTVLFRPGDEPLQIDVYALEVGFDLPAGHVTPEQSARRDALKALLARAAELGAGAEAYVPDRIRAVRFDPAVAGDPPATSPTWPGPPLSAFPPLAEGSGQSCLVIEGDDAVAVARADRENPRGTWEADGTVQTIVIVPVLPGQEGCPPS